MRCRRPASSDLAIDSAVRGRRNGRLILGSDIAALDSQGAGAIDAHEHAGASDLVRGIDDWSLLEGGERGLELGKAPVDLLRDVLRLAVALLQFVEFGSEGVVRGDLVLGERALLADEPAEIIGVAIGEVGRNLDPFPALRADSLRLAVELLRHEAVEQAGSCSQPPSSALNRSRRMRPPAAS